MTGPQMQRLREITGQQQGSQGFRGDVYSGQQYGMPSLATSGQQQGSQGFRGDVYSGQQYGMPSLATSGQQQAPNAQPQQQMPQGQMPGMQTGGSYADLLKNNIFADLNQKQARTNYFNVTPSIRAATNPNLLAVAATNKDVARGMADTLANQVSPGSKASDTDVENFMKYAADAALRKTKTGTQLNQMQYASNLDRFLDQGTQLMPSVIKYAGLAGRFKSAKDALAAASNEMPEDYSNYLNFTRVTVPEAAGEIGRALGRQATDNERQILDKVINPVYWDSNPRMALKQFNFLVDSFRGKYGINKSLASSNADIRQQLAGSQSSQQSVEEPSETKTLGNKTYIKINGKWHEQ
jgi:hypothetical protein